MLSRAAGPYVKRVERGAFGIRQWSSELGEVPILGADPGQTGQLLLGLVKKLAEAEFGEETAAGKLRVSDMVTGVDHKAELYLQPSSLSDPADKVCFELHSRQAICHASDASPPRRTRSARLSHR